MTQRSPLWIRKSMGPRIRFAPRVTLTPCIARTVWLEAAFIDEKDSGKGDESLAIAPCADVIHDNLLHYGVKNRCF
jgi:hypothetical protein